MKIVDVKTKDFAKYLDHPKQRNTEYRAAKATHLKTLGEQHKIVAAINFEGKIYKADGHTRSWLWENKHVKGPANLKCVMFEADTVSQLYKIYDFFDSSKAVETHMDKQHGAFRCHGFFPQSYLVQQGALSTAVRVMSHNLKNVVIDDCVADFLPELKLIDEAGYARSGWVSGLYAALIASVRRDGKEAFYFWNEFAQKNRTVVEISVLLEHIASKKAAKTLQSHREQHKLAKYAVNLYNKYTYGKGFNIQSLDIISYMEAK